MVVFLVCHHSYLQSLSSPPFISPHLLFLTLCGSPFFLWISNLLLGLWIFYYFSFNQFCWVICSTTLLPIQSYLEFSGVLQFCCVCKKWCFLNFSNLKNQGSEVKEEAAVVTNSWVGCCQGRGRRRRKRRVMGSSGIMVLKSIIDRCYIVHHHHEFVPSTSYLFGVAAA